MSDFFDVFIQNILPIFLVAFAGYILRRRLHLDKKALSSLTFYFFSPALVFSVLVASDLDGGELTELALFSFIVILSMGGVGLVTSRLLRLSRQDTVALLVVIMFVNGGNYGLTLNELRYGTDGLARAAVFYVVSTMMFFTLGIFIASMGQRNWQQALRRLITLPAFYAVVLAIAVYSMDISIPNPIMRTVEIAGAGAIPVMLVVLGMQIADLKDLSRIRLAVPASLVRLLIGPVIAGVVAGILGLQGLSRSTSIIEASMPTAVITTILATEFDLRQGMVTSTVVLSTLLSAITLPAVITILGL